MYQPACLQELGYVSKKKKRNGPEWIRLFVVNFRTVFGTTLTDNRTNIHRL